MTDPAKVEVPAGFLLVPDKPIAWGYYVRTPGRKGQMNLHVVTSEEFAADLMESGVDMIPLFAAEKDR